MALRAVSIPGATCVICAAEPSLLPGANQLLFHGHAAFRTEWLQAPAAFGGQGSGRSGEKAGSNPSGVEARLRGADADVLASPLGRAGILST